MKTRVLYQKGRVYKAFYEKKVYFTLEALQGDRKDYEWLGAKKMQSKGAYVTAGPFASIRYYWMCLYSASASIGPSPFCCAPACAEFCCAWSAFPAVCL